MARSQKIIAFIRISLKALVPLFLVVLGKTRSLCRFEIVTNFKPLLLLQTLEDLLSSVCVKLWRHMWLLAGTYTYTWRLHIWWLWPGTSCQQLRLLVLYDRFWSSANNLVDASFKPPPHLSAALIYLSISITLHRSACLTDPPLTCLSNKLVCVCVVPYIVPVVHKRS